MAKMRIGIANVNTGPIGRPEVFAQFARDTEELGFESVWAFEHTCVPRNHPPYPGTPDGQVPGGDRSPINEPLTQLTYAAALTTRLKVGTSAILLPLHHPLYLAKQLATLDVLSGGRVLFAIANGWMKEEYDALGIDWKVRGRRTDESIQALRALWRDEAASFHGTQFNFDEIYSFPKPVQKGGIPIIVGGYAPAAARRAGRIGDGFYPIIRERDKFKEAVALMGAEARKAGRDPDRIEITAGAAPLTLDAVKALEDLGVSRVLTRPPASDPAQLRPALAKIADEVIAKL
jgi:probable F420-dependent oxidoreductase